MPEFDVEPQRRRCKAPNPIATLLLVFRPRLFAAAGLVIAALVFGTPHLLVTYHCYGRCQTHARAYACDYLGVQGWRYVSAIDGSCPAIRLL